VFRPIGATPVLPPPPARRRPHPVRIGEAADAARPANKTKDEWVMFQVLIISGEEESLLVVGDEHVVLIEMFTLQSYFKSRHWVYMFEDQTYYSEITTPAFVPRLRRPPK
jgi:hypothetical protein